MTREEKLYSMTMKMLVAEAEKLGVKIDKKGSKQKAVEKMLAAEAEQETKTIEVETTEVETTEEIVTAEETAEETAEVETVKKEKKERVKKVNPDRIAFTEKIKTAVENAGGEFRTWEKLPSIFLIKMHNKSIVEVRYNKDGYKMAVNPARVETELETIQIKYYLKALTVESINYNNTEELERIIVEAAK